MLIEPIENLLNRNLRRSPAARELCLDLTGQKLAVELTGLAERFVVESLGTSLQLVRDPTLSAAVEVSGTPVNLLLMLSSDSQSVIAKRLLTNGDVRIKGDADVLQRYRNLLRLLQPDLPGEVEHLMGDQTLGRTVAHQLSQTVNAALHWGLHTARTATLNAAEYFAHETGDLVPRAEGEQFLSEVDLLRERADRLSARLEQLKKTLNPPRDSTEDVMS